MSNRLLSAFGYILTIGCRGPDWLIVCYEVVRLSSDRKISQAYAIRTTADGEEYTVAWFGDDSKDLSLLEENPRFVKFHITEIEGRASGDSLRSLSISPSVGLVETADKERQPAGIYWLEQLYSASK
ncbi:hypothetical protein [Paenibacillus tyrfis]|uniref:hypothetical protein n=1 Tax=Paenibacillus tyrfis TaxID=1501230 RepID=UPI00126A34CC|nr:hypothetical protein [Paenibacillus tyrfis]